MVSKSSQHNKDLLGKESNLIHPKFGATYSPGNLYQFQGGGSWKPERLSTISNSFLALETTFQGIKCWGEPCQTPTLCAGIPKGYLLGASELQVGPGRG